MSLYKDPSKASQVQTQNALLIDEYSSKQKLLQNTQLHDTKMHYQTGMYETLKNVNTYLLFFYYFVFIVVHALLLEQYFRGINMNKYVTAILFILLLVYPAIIYYVEMYVYSAIMYILSFIYGSTYVYSFDKALLNTDFYLPPPDENAAT